MSWRSDLVQGSPVMHVWNSSSNNWSGTPWLVKKRWHSNRQTDSCNNRTALQMACSRNIGADLLCPWSDVLWKNDQKTGHSLTKEYPVHSVQIKQLTCFIIGTHLLSLWVFWNSKTKKPILKANILLNNNKTTCNSKSVFVSLSYYFTFV